MNPKLDMIFKRRSIRAYENRAVPEELVRDLLEAAMAAPSACAKDPWRFVVLTDTDIRSRIAAGLPNGGFLQDAPLGIAVCGDMQAAHDGELSYMLQDCSAAIENLLLAAQTLGLGACWLGVHPREERVSLLREVLELPDSVMPVSCIALGFPAEEKISRTRYADDYVHRECW